MYDTIEAVSPVQARRGAEKPKTGSSRLWQRLALGGVLLISIFMNFYQLGQNGFANLYYASAIRSMLDSWHNFLFVAFDPGGFVSVDKPPLGFWLQAASAKIFGFTPFSIFLPQALAGVVSVWLLYYLVRRHFGVVAGLLAALALAISPISVLTNRNNTIDSTLVLVMLLGAWAVIRAAESGKLRWLLLCAVFVGLGFNIKMLEAYLVVPAYGLLYLLAAPRSTWVRIGHLALAALLMLSISLSWAVAVDLTPASSRPYVGSSQNNSEISLALGYNGIQRLLGQFGFGGSNAGSNMNGNATRQFQPPTSSNGTLPGNFPQSGSGSTGQPPQGIGSGNPGQAPQGAGGGMFNTGNPGLLRLFNEPLGGQIVWLLPMALFGMLALAWQRRPRPREDRQQQSLILWSTWLLTMAVFFSLATFFHQYYLSTFAPAICALFGIGVVVMWQDYRRSGWRGWLLPIALIVTALEQIHIITSNPTWGTWLIPLIAISCAIAAVILFAARLIPRLRVNSRVLASVVGLALLGLMLTSAVWSTIPVLANEAASLPVAGASGQSNFVGGERSNVNSALISYLEAHKGNAKYLVAVVSSNEADSLILATNQPVMALGGFSGSDPILTTSQLAALVKSGEVKYFLLNGTGDGGPGGNGQSALITWITQHAKVVSSSQWQSGSTSSTSNGFAGFEQLYEITSASSSTSSSALTIEARQEAAIAKIEPAVVELVVTTSQGEQIGSGVIIDSKGDIVTNYHIVNGENSITVVLYNGSKEQAQLVGTSTSNDLAVVHIQPFTNMSVAQIGNSSSLVVGQEVLAIGNPLGITETATKGIVSEQNRSVTEPTGTTISNAIQTDAAVNPGNSGGALINLQGQLIGIPTLTAVNTESNTAANGARFAIPSNLVQIVVQQILQQ